MKKTIYSLLMLSFTSVAFGKAMPADLPIDFSKMREYLTFEISSGYVESHSKKSCSLKHLSRTQADDVFMKAQDKIMDVNSWAKSIGIKGQSFRLFNYKGQLARRLARPGDLVEIKLPLDPTMRTYWVRIESLLVKLIKKDVDALHLVVRPTRNPFLSKKKNVTDHFFEKEATNSFIITRSPTLLTSEVHGVNEKANTTETRVWSDAAENLAISEMGWGIQQDGKAGMGFQKLVWNKLNAKLAKCE